MLLLSVACILLGMEMQRLAKQRQKKLWTYKYGQPKWLRYKLEAYDKQFL